MTTFYNCPCISRLSGSFFYAGGQYHSCNAKDDNRHLQRKSSRSAEILDSRASSRAEKRRKRADTQGVCALHHDCEMMPSTYASFSTCSKPSSTGVSRPKIETSTVSFCVVGSTSETTADIVANGPSVTVT